MPWRLEAETIYNPFKKNMKVMVSDNPLLLLPCLQPTAYQPSNATTYKKLQLPTGGIHDQTSRLLVRFELDPSSSHAGFPLDTCQSYMILVLFNAWIFFGVTVGPLWTQQDPRSMPIWYCPFSTRTCIVCPRDALVLFPFLFLVLLFRVRFIMSDKILSPLSSHEQILSASFCGLYSTS